MQTFSIAGLIIKCLRLHPAPNRGSRVSALTLGLGLRGFTPAGLPLTKNRRITGGKARVIGGICIFLSIVFLLDGLLWVVHLAGFIK